MRSIINKRGQTLAGNEGILIVVGVIVLAIVITFIFFGKELWQGAKDAFTSNNLATIAQGCGASSCVAGNEPGYCTTDLKSLKGLEATQIFAIANIIKDKSVELKDGKVSIIVTYPLTKDPITNDKSEWIDTSKKTAKVTCNTLARAKLANECSAISCGTA